MPGRRPTWRRPSGQGASPQQRRLCRTRLPRSKSRVVELVPHSGTELNNARPLRTYLAPPFCICRRWRCGGALPRFCSALTLLERSSHTCANLKAFYENKKNGVLIAFRSIARLPPLHAASRHIVSHRPYGISFVRTYTVFSSVQNDKRISTSDFRPPETVHKHSVAISKRGTKQKRFTVRIKMKMKLRIKQKLSILVKDFKSSQLCLYNTCK